MTTARGLLGSAAVALALVLGTASAASAQTDDSWLDAPTPPAEWPTATQDQLADSIVVFELGGITTFALDGSISTVESTEKEGDRTTISLATDILFQPDAWDIPGSAESRIAELVAEIPDGATVQVEGHTDSVVGAVENQELSENRASAVADVIAQERPDLELEVTGYADSRPAQAEDPDDPSTFAANRRVEIVYEG